jgi:hypothetical protein
MTMHDPANDFYDAACELLAAAQDLRDRARRSGAEAALAPALGCLQATLTELAAGVDGLAGRPETAPVRSALDHLAEELRAAEHAADVARGKAVPLHDTAERRAGPRFSHAAGGG